MCSSVIDCLCSNHYVEDETFAGHVCSFPNEGYAKTFLNVSIQHHVLHSMMLVCSWIVGFLFAVNKM
jgi:hypothetical protein